MNKEKAKQIIATWLVSSKGAKGQRGYIEGWFDEEDEEAFDLAIRALEREIEYGQMVVDLTKGEKVDDWVYDEDENATHTDCISRADTIKAMCAECRCEDECGGECTEVAIIKGMPSMSEEDVDYCNNCPYISWGKDCISRADVVEAIEGVDWYHVNSKGELVHGSTSDEESWYKAEDVYKAIESLPPVIPTERTGAWIEDGYYDSPFRICSYCGYEHQNQRGMWNYCPDCGAKMKDGTENE